MTRPEEIQKRLRSCRLLVMDFDGVMTNNMVWVDADGRETVACNRSDGLGIEMLRKFTDVGLVILSRDASPVAAVRAKKLNILCYSGCQEKAIQLKALVLEKGLKIEDVVYVGNDVNDVGCLREVGLGIAVAGSYREALDAASFVTNAKGGEGAVREICDMILTARGVRVESL